MPRCPRLPPPLRARPHRTGELIRTTKGRLAGLASRLKNEYFSRGLNLDDEAD